MASPRCRPYWRLPAIGEEGRRDRNLGRFTVRMTGSGVAAEDGDEKEEVDGQAMTAATEDRIEAAATVGDGGSARANCRGRGNGREGEMGLAVRRWWSIWTRFQIPRSPTGRTSQRNKVADGDHGRGHVDNSEDGNGEDGRRSRRVGEEKTEREGRRSSSETVAQVNGGRGERRERRESASRIKPRQLREMGRDEENGGDGAGAQRG